MSHSAKFVTAAVAIQFILAGRARFTLVSGKTGQRFTFRVTQKDATSPHFVGVLTGQDNESSYSFLGIIFGGKAYRQGRKSPISPEAPSAKAFAWAWGYLARGEMPPSCEVWHEGRCGRCSRVLTVPSSVELGFGPECASRG
jgi:Family of unknown function (DUF6011)